MTAPELASRWLPGRPRSSTQRNPDGTVDSVQWIDLPGPIPFRLDELETGYFAWVPRLTGDWVRPREEDSLCLGPIPFCWPPLIRMAPAQENPGRRARPIQGGLLARRQGEIAFERRDSNQGTRWIVAVRGLSPRIPAWLYHRFQSPLHVRTTFAFLRQLWYAWAQRNPERACIPEPPDPYWGP